MGKAASNPPPPSRAAFKRIRSIVKALGWDGEGVVGEITLGPRGAAQIQRLNFRRRITNTRTPATSYGPALGHSDSQHTITQIRWHWETRTHRYSDSWETRTLKYTNTLKHGHTDTLTHGHWHTNARWSRCAHTRPPPVSYTTSIISPFGRPLFSGAAPALASIKQIKLSSPDFSVPLQIAL